MPNLQERRASPAPHLHTEALRKLGWASWAMIVISLLIDTSHSRSFPSYNIVVGIWACYCGNRRLGGEAEGQEGKDLGGAASGIPEEQESLLKDVSAFSFVALASLLFDTLFCSVWGAEIFEGDSKSVKFSLIAFIMNMFMKVSAIFYASQIVVGAGSEGRPRGNASDPAAALATPAGGMQNRRVTFGGVSKNDGGRVSRRLEAPHHVPANTVAAGDGQEYVDVTMDIHSPFSSGVPGLLSPGMTPSKQERPPTTPTV